MKCLFIFGTRPEAIKLAPVIKTFSKDPRFDIKVCVTAQHREMLDQVLDFFSIKPDIDLDVMSHDQSLFGVTARIIERLESVMHEIDPDITFVQGDTTTAFLGALASFYKKRKVAHVEAGLRSKDIFAPFPEEVNRILVGRLTDYHFSPTKGAAINLDAEGITENIHIVGNTVIDALLLTSSILKERNLNDKFAKEFDFLDNSKRLILVTGHRRESFGKPFEEICRAIRKIVESFEDVEVIYPVHLNPNVRKPVNAILGGSDRIHLIEPVDYPRLVWLMEKSHLVLTDSGGIQEEAPSLGKPVLVMREVTERQEGIDAGTAKLVGTNESAIVKGLSHLLVDKNSYEHMARAHNPYGDGKSSGRILSIISESITSEVV